MKKSRIILIVGPTGTGKTNASINLAKMMSASVINADSTQIYKEPKIATAKIKEEEKCGIEHYMMDMVSLNDEYTLFDYQRDARSVLEKLIKENKDIIIVGGSGLYIKALLYNYELNKEEKTNIDFSSYSNQELKNWANKIDENNQIHVNNRQRLERYIRFYESSKSVQTKTNHINEPLYDFEVIGLKTDREKIYEHCNSRVDKMFDMGLLEEAKSLYDKHYKKYTSIIGYKELNEYFNGNISLEEAKNEIKKNTRHYAKRQMTWFNNQFDNIKWFNTDYDNFNNTINEIALYLKIKN